ncbi:DMT family transporter [Luteipulveratus sp. YIM 133132]|uniref:DMT family transporter n=1 Tax=Luteipulveratus flavus TaxID=3031728 RepID=UPI0023AF98C1|nr:DMT family transporter [Luteipulveratus sp. YIM 133132]MDE9367118.1 DMT family transporter [Luteipulveratus sp. YIM 133132]
MSSARSAALAGGVVSGALLAVQSRMNGALSVHSGQPVEAALWSFGSGLVVLSLMVLLVPRIRAGVREIGRAVRGGRLRWWQCIGGAAGGLLVAVQSWSVPLVGVAVFSIGVVGGQTLSALVVDRAGLGPAGVQHITPARVAAAALAVVGVVVSSTAHSGGHEVSLLPAAAAFAVGLLLAAQQAVNGRVNQVTGQPMSTTWQNFLVGLVVLLAVAGYQAAVSGGPWDLPTGSPWWAWFGGVLGIGVIGIMAWAVGEIGVLVFGLVSVAGQLLAALVLDLLDASTRDEVGGRLVLGLLITLVAAAGAGWAASRA